MLSLPQHLSRNACIGTLTKTAIAMITTRAMHTIDIATIASADTSGQFFSVDDSFVVAMA